jgi:hypothetical protein
VKIRDYFLTFIIFVLVQSCREKEQVVVYEYIPSVVKETFQITSPRSGDIWFTSQRYDIKWLPSSQAKNVVIELYRKNTLKKIISSKTENDGLFSYLIPNDLESSNLYKVKIFNYDDSTEFAFSGYFSIR